MIELGKIPIRDETSIVEAKKKIHLLAKGLEFSSIEATRLATITSELSRAIYQKGSESSIMVGFDKEADRFGLVLTFQSRREALSIGNAKVFFDKLHALRNKDGFQGIKAFKYLPDPEFRPTEKFIDTERKRLVHLSRTELLDETKRKNEELLKLFDELKERTAELAKAKALLEQEVSERKRAEEALLESEKKYRDFTDSLPQTVFELDEAGNFTFVNLNSLEIFDCDLDDSDKGWNALQMFVPEERDSIKENFERVLSGEELGSAEYTALKKDGSRFPVLVYASSIIKENKAVGSRGMVIDITEHKHAEDKIKRAAEEWRATFDSITDLISIHDKDFKLVRVNKAFANSLNMKPEELIGKTCYQVVHGTNEPVPGCPHKATLETNEPATGGFFTPHLGIHLEVTTSPIFNEKGEVVTSVHVSRDVTERRRMQEQLIVTDRLASVGELASGIAHELNNPLTSVIGFSELLLERDVPDDVKEDLRIINREAQRTAGVVRNLLTFARKHPQEKQSADINGVIKMVLAIRAYEQKVSNIQVNTYLAPDLPEIMADSFQFQQVFLNIITNAEYFMAEAHGRGTLTITTERVGDIVRISLADDGPGIAEENLGHVFDPFFTTKEVGKGTGLGLSICHGIVTEHGGRIYTESKLGKGATFVVELPIGQ